MLAFRYSALNENGKTVKGVIDALDHSDAIRRLEVQQLSPMDVQQQHGGKTASGGTKHLPMAKMLDFSRQLGGLLSAGVPMSRALTVIEKETTHPVAKTIWHDIHQRVQDGQSLAQAMQAQGAIFPSVHIAMVRAGEAGGFLDVVLAQVADFLEKQRELRTRVLGALIYPALLGVIATAVVVFLLIWFIPKFEEIFEQFGQQLPLLTRFIQGVSAILTEHGIWAAVGLLIVVVGTRFALATPKGKYVFERAVLNTPGLKHAVFQLSRVRFCRMLGTLLEAGVPLLRALSVAREAAGGQIMQQQLLQTESRVQQGEALSQSLSAAPQLIPLSVMETISVAEASGSLSQELKRLANYQEKELDRRLKTLVALVEPLLLMVMAAMVGTIVVGMLLPVFDLWGAVQ